MSDMPTTNDPTSTVDRDASVFLSTLLAEFPWLQSIGLDPGWFQEVAAEASGSAEILVKMRQTPQYKARFPGLYREDGQVRMNEAQYMAREQDFRTVLSQYGFDMSQYQTAASLRPFFENEFDPNEFRQRVETYRGVQQSSQAQKDAFYVYAGLTVTDDDLYQAIVDPSARESLTAAYNEAVAGSSNDYTQWITRATEVGLQRVSTALLGAQAEGLTTPEAAQRVMATDPGFARQMMDAIYTGGTGDVGQGLALEDLLNSFEYAAIGAAATNAGLDLPTKERLAEIRQAGIERAQAIQGYQGYGQRESAISGAVQRAGYSDFTQDDFERAQFLGDASLQRELQSGLARDAAAGRGSGEFRFGEDEGRLVQRGFGVR